MYYVVQVSTGKEEKTIAAIKRQIKDEKAFDVFSPYRKELRNYNGVYKEKIIRCFPGYIFVDTDDPKELHKILYFTPEFTKLLGREGLTDNFCPLSEDEARMIDILYSRNTNRITEISDIVILPGEKIRVLDGPLEGALANVVRVNLHKREVEISLTICGNSVRTKLPINIVTNYVGK